MVEDLIASILIPLVPVSIALAGVMWKIGDWINKKAEKKAAELKKVGEDTAEALAKNNLLTAEALKKVAGDTATSMISYNEKTAEALRKVALDTASSLADYNTKIEDKLAVKIDKVDEKQSAMLKDLSDRSDLVNGNVANIRNDITDLQEDIIELYTAEDVEYEKRDNGRDVEIDPGHGRDPMSSRKNKKRLEIERRKKRRQIEDDRINQDHPLVGKGRISSSSSRR